MPLFDATPPSVGRVPTAAAPHNWIAVACADHARRGRDELSPGFMQVCHGKCAPLKRMRPGDRVAYYAPTVSMGGTERCQRFVSIGVVLPGEPYVFNMDGGFAPHRRDVAYVPANEVPIQPLLDQFEFVEDRARWGYNFRFGLFAISDHDMALIARAMGASRAALGWPDAAQAAAPLPLPLPLAA